MNQDSGQPGLLGKLFALIAGAVLLVLGIMFSVVLLAVVVCLGLIAFGYFWWKTRALRKHMRDQVAAAQGQTQGYARGPGNVIEGEAIVVRERADTASPPLPDVLDKDRPH